MNLNYLNLFGLVLNLVGAILLAFSTEVYDPSQNPGVSIQILGHNLTTTNINKKRFNLGIGFLIAGFFMQGLGIFF
ncbi:MAG: hypothetical protein HY093_03905 [Candidatus Liptonbacteria bacterium]|nr:hypothetical protein [Candidatus Liptonbacteria bacterium]